MSLERLEITPISAVIGTIVADRESGQLTIVSRDARTDLYWSQGDLVLATTSPGERSLASFLVKHGHIAPEASKGLEVRDPADIAVRFFESGLLPAERVGPLLRAWIASIVAPLFSLEEGTSAWEEGMAIEPERRVFIPSPAAIILEGIRGITSGLALKRSLGDTTRRIRMARDPRFTLDTIPILDEERRIALGLDEPKTIGELLKQFPRESALAARVAIEMLTLGIFEIEHPDHEHETTEEMERSERDLAIMSALGPADDRSLRAFAFARHAQTSDYYKILDLPKGATRANIVANYERLRKLFEPAIYPPVLRALLAEATQILDRAHEVLTSTAKRAEYDRLMSQGRGNDPRAVHTMLVRRNIAETNVTKARELVVAGDYYGAVVLLKQSVNYVPDYADAWFLLAVCQQKNPNQKWQRDAMESLQRAISAYPNHTEAILTLGDIYRGAGLSARARACYEDAIAIEPDNGEAKARLKSLK